LGELAKETGGHFGEIELRGHKFFGEEAGFFFFMVIPLNWQLGRTQVYG
jgi:hypothetical protein